MDTEESVETMEEIVAQERHEKVMKGIAWVSVIASFMLFAGLISAYIVSKMDQFWANIELPSAFYTSTIIILLSSVTIVLALSSIKKNNQQQAKLFLGSTLLLGVAFMVFQFMGYSQLFNSGNATKGDIFFSYGAYGRDYVVLDQGQEIYYDGYKYLKNGEELTIDEVSNLKQFVFQICGHNRRAEINAYKVENYNNPYTINRVAKDTIKGGELSFQGKFALLNGDTLSPGEQGDLFNFAFGVYNDMPYFMIKGTYGEDFTINLNNEELEFEDRKLFFPERKLTEQEILAVETNVYQEGTEYNVKDGKVYSGGQEVNLSGLELYMMLNDGIEVRIKDGEWVQLRQELNNAQYAKFYDAQNIASSYIYVLTFLHLIHIVIALIVLLVALIRTIKGRYNAQKQTGIRATGIIWHFLGVLWVCLFVILQYFH